MSACTPARLRTLWWTLHRWIGIRLAVLLLPIAVSGALLVWHDHLDAVFHPNRYAVSGKEVVQPPSAYLASATAALAGSAQPVALRFPASEGAPVIVSARSAGAQGGRPRIINVYLDPPSARVLLRAIHDGSRGGPVWQVAVFLTGVFPVIFVVTGTVMWLRGRRGRRALAVAEAKLQAAE